MNKILFDNQFIIYELNSLKAPISRFVSRKNNEKVLKKQRPILYKNSKKLFLAEFFEFFFIFFILNKNKPFY